mgnify:FL=1
MTRLSLVTPYWEIAIYAIVVGAGLGLTMQTIVIALQNDIDFKLLGIATSSNTFFRTLGGAFGTAIFGTILSHNVSHNLKDGFAALAKTNPEVLSKVDPTLLTSITTNTGAIAKLPAVVQNTVLEGFMSAFHSVFIAAFPVVALGLVFAIFLKEKPLQDSSAHSAARQDAAGEALG